MLEAVCLKLLLKAVLNRIKYDCYNPESTTGLEKAVEQQLIWEHYQPFSSKAAKAFSLQVCTMTEEDSNTFDVGDTKVGQNRRGGTHVPMRGNYDRHGNARQNSVTIKLEAGC